MESLKITLSNSKLEELGLDSPMEYTNFYFNTKDLIGYWIAHEEEEPVEILVYIGSFKFVAPYSEKTINRMNEILKQNSKL